MIITGEYFLCCSQLISVRDSIVPYRSSLTVEGKMVEVKMVQVKMVEVKMVEIKAPQVLESNTTSCVLNSLNKSTF